MAMTVYQVDAFASDVFGGNPAAVIKLEQFLPPDLMQNIAMENNLSETAYVVPRKAPHHYDLRWFTPTLEIEFCGHATIATAHALAVEFEIAPPFHFHTQVGELVVSTDGALYVMDAPVFTARPTAVTPEMTAAFPAPIDSAFIAADNLYIVLKNESDVRNAAPDMALVEALSTHGVGLTAQGTGEFDCVSRLFVPAQGIDEDPVTGSAHAAIGPYWAARLGKQNLTAYQASSRGGILHLGVGETRLTIAGQAVTFMQGEIRL